MRKLVELTYMSLDGVISSPEKWSMPFWDDEHEGHTLRLLRGADALLLGRRTYEGFAASWRNETGEIADRMNLLPKYVASRTLRDTTWNASLFSGDIAEQVAALKHQEGGSLLKFGTGQLDHTLVRHGLVDEFHFLIYPVAVGNDLSDHDPEGGAWISDGFDMTYLRLVEATTFPSGVLNAVFEPARGNVTEMDEWRIG